MNKPKKVIGIVSPTTPPVQSEIVEAQEGDEKVESIQNTSVDEKEELTIYEEVFYRSGGLL